FRHSVGGASLCGIANLDATIKTHPQVHGGDHQQHEHARQHGEFHRRRARGVALSAEPKLAEPMAHCRLEMVLHCQSSGHLSLVHSTSFVSEAPSGFVPFPAQLIAKFELPVKVTVFATSWVQPFALFAPPANFTAPFGT